MKDRRSKDKVMESRILETPFTISVLTSWKRYSSSKDLKEMRNLSRI